MTNADPISSAQKTSPGERMLKNAEEAVRLLGLEGFIKDNKAPIYQQLEDCDERVKVGPSGLDPDASFIAQSLHMIGGVIHVGSTRAHFDEAAVWVKRPHAHAEPTSLLSTLVLVYVVDQGWRDANASNDEAKKVRWNSIHRRAEWLCEKQEPKCVEDSPI
jgi:hypothetical protein